MDMDTSSSEMLSSVMENQKRNNANKCNQFAQVSVQAGGRTKHKCNICDYASLRAGNLRTHLKTHSGEKAYKCSQCDFATVHAHNLRTHLKTHSGEKSYKMQPLRLCICSCIHFDGTFENSLWRKVVQMQAM